MLQNLLGIPLTILLFVILGCYSYSKFSSYTKFLFDIIVSGCGGASCHLQYRRRVDFVGHVCCVVFSRLARGRWSSPFPCADTRVAFPILEKTSGCPVAHRIRQMCTSGFDLPTSCCRWYLAVGVNQSTNPSLVLSEMI